MRTLPLTLALCGLSLTAVGALASAQDEEIRPILAGEKAAIVFSPEGGYAPQNYLKQFRSGQARTWATQNGTLKELIQRAPQGSKIRIGAFKLSDEAVIDALFTAAETKNVEVKLWLKGPPGLTYMVDKHRALARRANDYLRRRAQQGNKSSWGDFQVMIGTAAKMSAFGKVNDMHTKFGIVGASETHAAGFNHAFLGTSNIGSSSDAWHNENRLFLFEHPAATQRLWEDFSRIWRNLGECETYTDGDSSKGVNLTPEPTTPQIRLADGTLAREEASDPVQLRFTYEKSGSAWHKISDDYVSAFAEARHLKAGETVWVAQFGFGVRRISRALEQAARDNPAVTFKVMVHMGEADSSAVRSLATSGLANLSVYVKWDSSGLKLSKGQRPRVPRPGDPGPSLLHHKTLALGSRLLITGSYNFFSDADDQGENIAIVRPHLDASYASLLADTQAEFAAMEASGVLLNATKLFGSTGLFDQVRRRSNEDGFLKAIERLPASFTTPADLLQRLRSNGGPGLDDLSQATLDAWLADLVRFEFTELDPQGRVRRRPNRDERAHAGKAAVRQAAKDPPAGPAPQVLEGTIRSGGILEVQGERYVLPSALATTLAPFEGRPARVRALVGTLTPKALSQTTLLSPRVATLSGTVADPASGPTLAVGSETLEVWGSLASGLSKVAGRQARVRGWVFSDAAGKRLAIQVEALAAKALRKTELRQNWQATGHSLEVGDEVWIERFSGFGRWAKVRAGTAVGYVSSSRLRWDDLSGITGALQPSGN